NAISQRTKQRQKNLFDFCVGFFFLLLSPILCWFYKNKVQFFKNCFDLIRGKKTVVSYNNSPVGKRTLPKLKNGILNTWDATSITDEQLKSKLDLLYAREYNVLKDMEILWKSWKKMGQSKN
ncbi:MAG TPA: hypothetical protein PLI97_03405, partial [Fluviicola sp.]|nr:hypothetical protein [Fluviicola sp.]